MNESKENILFGIILIVLVIGGFGAGYSYHLNVIDHRVKERDTLVFKSHNQDSMKLHVVLHNGKLQAFWYSKKYLK